MKGLEMDRLSGSNMESIQEFLVAVFLTSHAKHELIHE